MVTGVFKFLKYENLSETLASEPVLARTYIWLLIDPMIPFFKKVDSFRSFYVENCMSRVRTFRHDLTPCVQKRSAHLSINDSKFVIRYERSTSLSML